MQKVAKIQYISELEKTVVQDHMSLPKFQVWKKKILRFQKLNPGWSLSEMHHYQVFSESQTKFRKSQRALNQNVRINLHGTFTPFMPRKFCHEVFFFCKPTFVPSVRSCKFDVYKSDSILHATESPLDHNSERRFSFQHEIKSLEMANFSTRQVYKTIIWCPHRYLKPRDVLICFQTPWGSPFGTIQRAINDEGLQCWLEGSSFIGNGANTFRLVGTRSEENPAPHYAFSDVSIKSLQLLRLASSALKASYFHACGIFELQNQRPEKPSLILNQCSNLLTLTCSDMMKAFCSGEDSSFIPTNSWDTVTDQNLIAYDMYDLIRSGPWNVERETDAGNSRRLDILFSNRPMPFHF